MDDPHHCLRRVVTCLAALAAATLASGCRTARVPTSDPGSYDSAPELAGQPPSPVAAPDGWRPIRRLITQNLKARRPAGPVARAQAEPGDPDYGNAAGAGGCRAIAELLEPDAPDTAEATRACLVSIEDGARVSYRLARDPQPYWQLLEPERAPDCLRARLARIPVPREIVFQTNDEGRLGCYAASLDIDADRVLRIRLPLRRLNLTIAFPLAKPPRDLAQLQALLMTWMLEPFWTVSDAATTPRVIPSRPVAERACEECLGRGRMFKPWKPIPPLWPAAID